MSELSQSPEFRTFVDELKQKIKIGELYENLTGNHFGVYEGRHRAKIAWRDDKNPSLCLVVEKNILTDFTDHVEGSDKAGRSYNPLDLFIKCGGAINFWHAIEMACNYTNSQEDFKKFSKFNKSESGYDGVPILGSKIKEVWDLCKQKLRENFNKSSELMTFLKDKNIPFDLKFLETINVGMAPSDEEIFEILGKTGILRKAAKGQKEELSIMRKGIANNALVFPLYNLNGALCGLKFRKLTEKDFAEWIPVGHGCFYNGQRFKNFRAMQRELILIEGEMNLVAFAIGAFKHSKSSDPYLSLDTALNLVYATGSKSNTSTTFKERVKKVIYIQDYDVASVDEFTSPHEHPVLRTCLRVDKEVCADEIQIVDWPSTTNVLEKGQDLEDYLKANDYNIELIYGMKKFGIPKYTVNVIDEYVKTFEDEDIRKEVLLRYVTEMSQSFQDYARKEVFYELANKRFHLTNQESKEIKFVKIDCIRVGEYGTDSVGRIVKYSESKDTGEVTTRLLTNFHTRIGNATTVYPNSSDDIVKYFTVEAVVDGMVSFSFKTPPAGVVNGLEFKELLAKYADDHTELKYIDPIVRDKKFQEVVMAIMNEMPIRDKKYIFSSLGRPNPDADKDICSGLLKTTSYCLLPEVSVVNGAVTNNGAVDVNLPLAKDKMKFKFSQISDDDCKKAGKLFWNNLRHIHDSNIIDSLIGQVFDSCTRELQAYGRVKAEHGYPIYLAGESGSYKTTAALAAMSLLGDFKTQDDVLSWHGTGLSIENLLLPVGTLTHVFDDMKIEEMQGKDFINFFHAVYGGSTKTKMAGNSGEVKGGKKISCSVIITSETGNVNIPESIAARMLVLRIKKCNSKVGEARQAHLSKMYEEKHDATTFNIDLMRGFFPTIVAWAQQRGSDPYVACVTKWKRHYTKLVAHRRNNIERPTDMTARTVAAFNQICEFIKANNIAPAEEVDKQFADFVDYWDEQIILQVNRIESQSSTYKSISMLWQIMQTGIVGIKEFKNGRWVEQLTRYNSQYFLADVEYSDGMGRKILIISVDGILKLMNGLIDKNGVQVVKGKFTNDLMENGIIEPEPYPMPDARGGLSNVKYLAIDYDKLVETVERIQENDQNN